MKYYFCKLLPPRPTFTLDMSTEERAIMTQHSAYWKGWLKKGNAIVFGPVADPKGSFGLGVIGLEDADNVQDILDHDPAILSERGFRYEVHPMLSAIHR